MKKYEIVTPEGEVYSVSHRHDSNWNFQGWNLYKNDNFITLIPNVSFELNGVNVTCKDDADAIKLGRVIEKIEADAEKAFFLQHPELNP